MYFFLNCFFSETVLLIVLVFVLQAEGWLLVLPVDNGSWLGVSVGLCWAFSVALSGRVKS